MCRATWTESGCESQAGPMELWPEPVLIKTRPLWPSQNHSESMLVHAGPMLEPTATHSTPSTRCSPRRLDTQKADPPVRSVRVLTGPRIPARDHRSQRISSPSLLARGRSHRFSFPSLSRLTRSFLFIFVI